MKNVAEAIGPGVTPGVQVVSAAGFEQEVTSSMALRESCVSRVLVAVAMETAEVAVAVGTAEVAAMRRQPRQRGRQTSACRAFSSKKGTAANPHFDQREKPVRSRGSYGVVYNAPHRPYSGHGVAA